MRSSKEPRRWSLKSPASSARGTFATRVDWRRQAKRVAWSCGRGDLPREAKADVLPGYLDLPELVVAERREPAQDERYELLGRGRSGRHADRLVAGQQLGVDPALTVDQQRGGAVTLGHLDQAARVVAGLGADHEDQRRALLGELLDRVLPVLGRVADVVRGRPLEVAEALAQRIDGLGDVVERERRLRDHRDRLAVGVELGGVLGRLDHDRRLG